VNIDRGWDGYYIEIEGKTIVASRDSKCHKWIFKNGRDWDAPVFHEISEKKGEAILEFLKKLSTCRQSKKTSKGAEDEDTLYFPGNSKEISGAAVSEENLDSRGGEDTFDKDQDEDTFDLPGNDKDQEVMVYG